MIGSPFPDFVLRRTATYAPVRRLSGRRKLSARWLLVKRSKPVGEERIAERSFTRPAPNLVRNE
jgi:hypothetical protein